MGVTGAKVYATSAEGSGNRLVKIVDNGPASTPTTIATASASSTFSGVSFGPLIVPVSIVSQPQNQIVVTGTGAQFSVGATGTAPLFYQWLWNGTNVAGGTASTLVISASQAALAGNYSVVVSNLAPSSVASSTASISFAPYLTFFTNFSSWSANGTGGSGLPIFDAGGQNNVIELTQGVAQQASSSFYQSPVYIGGFRASWTYQLVSPSGAAADGTAFVIQNDSRGPAALGGNGGGLGYSGIKPSIAFEMDVYTNASGGEGIALDTNGATGPYVSTAPVDFDTGDPINVTVQYGNGLARVTLVDTVNSNSYTTSAAVNVPAVVKSNLAYVGFTAADGAVTSTQTISNFVFLSLVPLSAVNNGNTLTLSWPTLGAGTSMLQQSPTLSPSSWTAVTNAVSAVNGTNSVTVPIVGTSMFYEVVTP
jgi:hypothetical protein